MKKLLSIVVACLLSASVFAGGKYMGDVQVHIGFGDDSVQMKYSGSKLEVNAPMFVAEVESWNLFRINDVFSIGAFAEFGFGIGCIDKCVSPTGTATRSQLEQMFGESYRMELIFGPAFGFDIKEIVRIQATAGFALGFRNGCKVKEMDIDAKGDLTKGIAFEVQGKFFPTKRFSPIAGYRLSLEFFDGLVMSNGSQSETMGITEGIYAGNTIYIGGSFNW